MTALNGFSFPEKIKGKFIDLRRITVADAELTYKWRTSKVAQHLNQPVGYCLEMQKEWINSRPESEGNYIINTNMHGIDVGMVSILDLDWHNKVGSVGRLLLDEEIVKISQPYGVEALLLTYQFVFDVLGFRKITGVILAKNKKVFELQSYLGMIQEGYLERHVLLRGEEESEYVMSLFKEFFPGYKAKIEKIMSKYDNSMY